jgi:RNA polymerase sigma factor (sigma-70 family)
VLPATKSGRDTTPSQWPDAWLVNAIRRDPPDQEALSALVDRYWKTLFARCRMLTIEREAASDLAQEAWLRVLRARRSLDPDGNFHAYITTIATNLWRDRHRVARRAGLLAENRLSSLDSATTEGGEPVSLIDVIADPRALSLDDQALLAMDLDLALARLSSHLRDVLISRFVLGESAAEIGRRYDRTEQSITGWIREAVREMKIHLGEHAGHTD